jgi:hypothetical protein
MTVRLALAVALAGIVAAGCGGAAEPRGDVPVSAALAPADALVFATVTTDETSAQWTTAERLLERIPGARDGLGMLVGVTLEEKGLTWEGDVAPAVGKEVVLVVTGARKLIVLTQPDSEERLAALLDELDEPVERASVSGWLALAERSSDLTDYQAALARGTLEADDRVAAGFAALPSEALVRVWVDAAAATRQLGEALQQASQEVDLGIDWLSAAVSAEDEGIRLALGTRTPDGGDTRYEPELFAQVPADAVVALSFGGTQGLLDRVQGSIPIDEISNQVEETTGVSLDGLVEALSGEGLLYVRAGDRIPEVTLVLAPPDADEAWETVDRVVRSLARGVDATVETATEDGREVRRVQVEDFTLRYARLDEDTVIVTTGAGGIHAFAEDGPKLVSGDAYLRAADEVGLQERTSGFAYVDIDGLLPLVEGLAGEEQVPPDAREVVEALDSFILQSSADGDTTTVSGFLRLND